MSTRSLLKGIFVLAAAFMFMLLTHYGTASASITSPVISPNSGTYTSAQSVSIYDIYGTAYYTTDDSNPETSSTRLAYNGVFTVSQSETIQAVNYSNGAWSGVTTAIFIINGGSTIQQPSIYPDGGSFASPVSVTIGNIQSGGTAYYTIDGSNPESSGTRLAYNAAFSVSQSETIQAVNYINGAWSGMTSATFYISGTSTYRDPSISPDGGSFSSPPSVTIVDVYGTAYYTTDDSNPETSGTRILYGGSFIVSQSETIQAVNYYSGTWSDVISAYFNINSPLTQQTPIIYPIGGTFSSPVSVTLADINGTAYYTTDGSNPETSGTHIAYSGPFTVSQSETVLAVNYNNSAWSGVTSASFIINGSSTSQPSIYPDGGSFASPASVTIGNIYGTAYYTTDGSNPENSGTHIAYSGPFTVSQSETVLAVNYNNSAWSAVTPASFIISATSALQAPVIYPNGGSFSAAQSVTIGNIRSGDTAYYTTDGSNPVSSSTANLYSGAFSVSQSATLQAAIHDPTLGWSGVTSASFTISGTSALQAPVIYPNGGSFTAAQSVTIGNIQSGDTAYYTTDGSNPVSSSTANAYSGAFSVSQSATVQAAIHDPTLGWSGVTSASFTISGTSALQAPVIYPNGGSFTAAQSVTIGNIQSGDTAYYTTDGSNPVSSSTANAYSGAFSVSQSATVQAAIHDPTLGWSGVTSASFTIGSQPAQSGNNSSNQLAQLQQEFVTALNNNQLDQATMILKQIDQIDQMQDTLANQEEQLTTAINNNNWSDAEAILKSIIGAQNPAWAYTQLGQIYQQQGFSTISVFVNGTEVSFDVPPVIVNSRVLVPIRKIANALGVSDNNIIWNSDGTVTINNGSNTILIMENENKIYLNGTAYTIDTPAQIIDSRMLVPLRAISQLLNKNIQWYPTGKIVEIS